MMSRSSVVTAFLCSISPLWAEEVIRLSVDSDRVAAFPLQKTQFGVSYVDLSEESRSNVFDLLQVRHARNNDKRLQSTWTGWDENGDPIYESCGRVSDLLIAASQHGVLGGANLQGPVEHPDVGSYLKGSRLENQWNWSKFSRDSRLYHEHLRQEIDGAGRVGHPFVFGVGHESNNDASLESMGLEEGCLDGIAFMGPLPEFRERVLEQGRKAEGDRIQAREFFRWYGRTIDELIESYGSRDAFLIAAAQPHTNSRAVPALLATLVDLIDGGAAGYLPDYLGCHSRWNIPGDRRLFKTIVEPSRALLARSERWQAVPLMCNEFGAQDYLPEYDGTLRAAVSLLSDFERVLESPDVGYINFIYNRYFEEGRGRQLHPVFHAFRFYQGMPQRRTEVRGPLPEDLHVLSSSSRSGRQEAMIWRDAATEGVRQVEFTFHNSGEEWQQARASLYVMKAQDPSEVLRSRRSDTDFGFAAHLVEGYPRLLRRGAALKEVTFSDIELPPASIAMLRLERLDGDGEVIPDAHLLRRGPTGAMYLKTWQWTARNPGGGVDPAWGLFDHRNWTLFAGVASRAGTGGSAVADYLPAGADPRVRRGLAGVEFRSGAALLPLEIEVESGRFEPDERQLEAFGGLRIDFYNGDTDRFDAALMWAGNCCPSGESYRSDSVPWGFGGDDPTVVPQQLRLGLKLDERFEIDLDEEYRRLTGSPDAAAFVSGGRRVIVSAWVENLKGGLVVRLGAD